jgi:hypothetical protein
MNSGRADDAAEPADGDEPRSPGPHRPVNRPRVRSAPGPIALLALYPAAWRRRYGDELDALILDMHADGRDTGWRVRADVLRAVAREHLGGGQRGDPSRRIEGGASLVLWAWAVFVLAGAIVAKTTEHWQRSLSGHPASIAEVAFGGLIVVAAAAAVLVAAGIALTLPAAIRLLREGGWSRIRSRTLVAAALTVAAVAATIVLVAWAHRVTVLDRNGHDSLYAGVFLCWAALVGATVLAWTAVATGIARGLRCGRAVLCAHALLAPVVTVLMAVMTAATVAWWAIVGHNSPAALTGGASAAQASAIVPQLVVAGALMLIATTIAAVGAARADAALPELQR